MDTIKILLGKKEFLITHQPIRKSRTVREFLQTKIDSLGSIIGFETIQITDAQKLQSLINSVKDLVIKSPDIALDVILKYSPELESQKNWVEENAFDEEVIVAFMEVVKLLYPFGVLRDSLRGLTMLMTSTNSASPNMEDGQMNSNQTS